MTVDADAIEALAVVLEDLQEGRHSPIPPRTIKALSGLSMGGRRLRLDLEASRMLGAPLITVFETPCDTAFLSPLTPRQKEVARLLIDGKSNRDIAETCGISVATVKDHVHAVLQRLNLPSRGAVMAAARAAARN
ncbi:helix-turn-helix transcriptional regulator [Roseibium sp.]|uniref:helix-turn-helix transcriptional regulator n=1 Tax=Roseibium sp. TaxID=1936156 RepID=UPI003B5131F6